MAEKQFTPIKGMHPSGVMPVLEAFPDAETVTVTSPKEVILTIDRSHEPKAKGHLQVRIPVGIQEIPEFLVKPEMHWWLKANGVKTYEVARKENDDKKLTKTPTNPTPQVAVSLEDMTKADLIEHAGKVHDLTLTSSLKKEEMIAAIQEAAAEKAKVS